MFDVVCQLCVHNLAALGGQGAALNMWVHVGQLVGPVVATSVANGQMAQTILKLDFGWARVGCVCAPHMHWVGASCPYPGQWVAQTPKAVPNERSHQADRGDVFKKM